MSDNDNNDPIIKDPNQVARALEVLFASNYISLRRLHWENFVRGLFFGAGSIIGATVLIAIIIWFLSLFDSIPVVGPLLDNTRETIQQGQQR